MEDERPKPKFIKGQKVLCYEPDPQKQTVVYHSVVMQVDYEGISDTEDESNGAGEEVKKIILPVYLIHFQNWGSQYDRWVTEELVLETTPDSLILKEELDKKVTGNKPYPKRKTPRKPQADKALDQTPDNQPPNILDPNRKFRMKLSLPPTLKQALERDFVNVTLRNLLIKLPRNPNIETILSSFVKSHTELHPTGDTKSLQDFVDGIITCFDFTLPLQLLYKEERSQLEREGFTHSGSRIKRQNIISDQGGVHVMYPGYTSWGTDTQPGPIKPSLIYGAEHLLRLFVKLPELFDHLEPEYLNNFTYFCQTFLDYVAKNRAEVFVEIQPYKEAELCDLG